jgi:dihydropteroate synthase
VIDPGPGFGKTTEHDIELLRKIDRFTALPFPVLLAASRKKFIGDVLGLGPEERLEGSLAVIAWCVLHGVKLVRVHDVKASLRVCRMTEAVLHPESVEEVRT